MIQVGDLVRRIEALEIERDRLEQELLKTGQKKPVENVGVGPKGPGVRWQRED